MKSFLPDYTKISIFRRKKGKIEEYVVKIIYESDICKSRPLLKTILIENVRICCVVVETSGRNSVKVLCSSAPYIVSLISKSNPKLERFLSNVDLKTYFSFLQNSEFQKCLENVFEKVATFYRTTKTNYPTFTGYIYEEICKIALIIFRVLKVSFERTYSYLAKCGHNVNYQFICDATNSLLLWTSSAWKSITFLFIFAKKAIVSSFRTLRSHSINRAVEYISSILEKLYLIFRSFVSDYYSDICNLLQNVCSCLYDFCKPHIKNGLKKYSIALPLLFRHLKRAGVVSLEYIEVLWMITRDNIDLLMWSHNILKEALLCLCKKIQPLCVTLYCLLCRMFTYICDIYPCLILHFQKLLSSSFRTVHFILRHIIECIKTNWSKFCHFATHEKLLHYVRSIIHCTKILLLHAANDSKIIANCMLEVVRELLPSFWPAVSEIYSSLFSASTEVVSKSLLGVKRISPSFFRGLKCVAPPTVRAVQEIVKTSRNVFVILPPSVLEASMFIRPQLLQASVILLSDANGACREITYVTYLASTEISCVAINIVENIPTVYKAVRAVTSTSSSAVVEITSVSLSAKCRVLSDFKSASFVIHSSLLLAEEEIGNTIISSMSELNSVINYLPDIHFIRNARSFICKYVSSYASIIQSCFLRSCDKIFHEIYRRFLHSVCSAVSLENIQAGILNLSAVLLNFKSGLIHEQVSSFFVILWNLMHYLLYKTSDEIHSASPLLYSRMIKYCKFLAHFGVSKTWSSLKFSASVSWDLLCNICPKFWTTTEKVSFKIFELLVLYSPAMWDTTKKIINDAWDLLIDNIPAVWNLICVTAPFLYNYERKVIRSSWNLYVVTCRTWWIASKDWFSTMWSCLNDYGPKLWFKGCEKASRLWTTFCSSIYKNYTAGTLECVLYWTVLQDIVIISWKTVCRVSRSLHSTCYSGCLMMRKATITVSKSKDYITGVGKVIQLNSLTSKMPNCATRWFNSKIEF